MTTTAMTLSTTSWVTQQQFDVAVNVAAAAAAAAATTITAAGLPQRCVLQALVDRLSGAGVAPVEWIDIEGVPVAVGSGEGQGDSRRQSASSSTSCFLSSRVHSSASRLNLCEDVQVRETVCEDCPKVSNAAVAVVCCCSCGDC